MLGQKTVRGNKVKRERHGKLLLAYSIVSVILLILVQRMSNRKGAIPFTELVQRIFNLDKI